MKIVPMFFLITFSDVTSPSATSSEVVIGNGRNFDHSWMQMYSGVWYLNIVDMCCVDMWVVLIKNIKMIIMFFRLFLMRRIPICIKGNSTKMSTS